MKPNPALTAVPNAKIDHLNSESWKLGRDSEFKVRSKIAERERRKTRNWIALTTVLFLAGGAAGYFLHVMVMI